MAEPLAIAYLNGRFAPLDELRLPVLDRGFLFGDAVYEVMPVYGGQGFRSPQHFARLTHSLEQIYLLNPLTSGDWDRLTTDLIRRNGGGSMSIYLQISRGVESGRDHRIRAEVRPTVFAMAMHLPPRSDTLAAEGITAITLADNRWSRCDIKSTALLPNVLLASEAARADAHEAILLRDGYVTEGSSSSVFAVREGAATAPPYGYDLLPGTTRDLVSDIARHAGIEVHEAPLAESALRDAEEIWICSATREVMPVTRLDGEAIGGGVPGPLWQRIDALYQECKQRGGYL